MQERRQAESIRKRHSKRQQKRRRQQLIRRTIFLGSLSVILLSVIIFLTPIFNIRSVNVEGNVIIETAKLSEALESFKGENLLLTSSKDARKALSSFAYIDKVSVKKGIFPPSVTVVIDECKPACYLMHSKSFVVIDKTGKILDVSETKPEITELAGLKLTSANAGEGLSLDDNSNLKTVISMLGDFEKSGLLSGVTKINMEDIDSITFNYENRIDGLCGAYSDFSRKLGLFREAITSNKLTENSRGTIDLTKTGKAVYTP